MVGQSGLASQCFKLPALRKEWSSGDSIWPELDGSEISKLLTMNQIKILNLWLLSSLWIWPMSCSKRKHHQDWTGPKRCGKWGICMAMCILGWGLISTWMQRKSWMYQVIYLRYGAERPGIIVHMQARETTETRSIVWSRIQWTLAVIVGGGCDVPSPHKLVDHHVHAVIKADGSWSLV